MGSPILSNQSIERANRRETLLWVGAAAFFLTSLMLMVMLGIFATPVTPRAAIGNVSDFPSGMEPRLISANNQQVFVVSLEGEIKVFDRRTPHMTTRCFYKWVQYNNRFEDPCGGSKFEMDGTWIEGPAPRSLDYYTVTIDPNGTVWVDIGWTIKGELHPE